MSKRLAVICRIALCCFPTLLAGSEKISRDLVRTERDEPVSVIVRYHSSPTAEHERRASSLQAAFVRRLDAIRSNVYRMPPSKVEALAADPEVEYVTPDRPVYPSMDVNAVTVGADIAQKYGYTGAGVGVAVIDSGVSNPPDLASQLVYRESLISLNADEVYGHGTHVAGAIA